MSVTPPSKVRYHVRKLILSSYMYVELVFVAPPDGAMHSVWLASRDVGISGEEVMVLP